MKDIAMTAVTPVDIVPRKRARTRRRIPGEAVLLALSGLWLLAVLTAAVAPSLLAPVNPEQLDPSLVLQAPGTGHLLGTDQYGRSVYVLLVHGASTAMTVGLASTAIALVVGGGIGLLAGYAGGIVDGIISRLLDILLSLPGVLLALVITAAAGPSVEVLVFSVATGFVAGFARIMRGQVLSVRSRLFVEAAQSVGLGRLRIALRHVLPNAMGPLLALATIAVGEAILVASALSFLGLGPELRVPDWGQLLAEGQSFLRQSPWVSVYAGLVISLTVISVSLIGDWLRERWER